jgi:hypothetical protein
MAAFEIDEKKLRSALPAPTSSTAEDLKWSGAFIGLGALFIALFGFAGWLLIRALL